MLQNPCKTLGFKKNMVYKIPQGGGGGKPYPAIGLYAKLNPNIACGSRVMIISLCIHSIDSLCA